jgi:hypothetical protein
MNKKILMKITTVFVVLYIIFSINSMVNAATISNMYTQTQTFLNKGKSMADGNIDITNSVTEVASIGSILTTVGIAVMIGATAYMGIRYLTAPPDGKAKLKVQLIGLIVAGVVIFGAYYIWQLAINVFSKF